MNLHLPDILPKESMSIEPHSGYLDRLMRRGSFEALWPLFKKATKPAKELTESFSALDHLRPFIKKTGACRVIHVGDGAHARTAALFALKTQALNISVDPLINKPLVSNWQEQFNVERFSWRKARLEEVADELNALPLLPTFYTFVHAHIDLDMELSRIKWDAAFTMACCKPKCQFTKRHLVIDSGEDQGVLSPERRFQVLVNRESSWAQNELRSSPD